jgi:hypothetical protein
MQSETIGGSSDTDVNELAAIPTGVPSMQAATAVTPVGKLDRTLRKVAELRKGTAFNVADLRS